MCECPFKLALLCWLSFIMTCDSRLPTHIVPYYYFNLYNIFAKHLYFRKSLKCEFFCKYLFDLILNIAHTLGIYVESFTVALKWLIICRFILIVSTLSPNYSVLLDKFNPCTKTTQFLNSNPLGPIDNVLWFHWSCDVIIP